MFSWINLLSIKLAVSLRDEREVYRSTLAFQQQNVLYMLMSPLLSHHYLQPHSLGCTHYFQWGRSWNVHATWHLASEVLLITTHVASQFVKITNGQYQIPCWAPSSLLWINSLSLLSSSLSSPTLLLLWRRRWFQWVFTEDFHLF